MNTTTRELTYIERIHAKDSALAKIQLRINESTVTAFGIRWCATDGARRLILTVAEATHAEYPQYAGHWDGWKVCICTKNLTMKHRGPAAYRGDYCLVKPDFSAVFCPRTGGDVGLDPFAALPDSHRQPPGDEFRKYFQLY